MATTIRTAESNESVPTLFVALELSAKQWRLAMAAGPGAAPSEGAVAPGDGPAFDRVLARAKGRCGLSADARVVSCYEAGRDGFWVARWLTARGIGNVVVDSASIEVPRRARRVKTDRIDARSLLRLLMRHHAGDRQVWRTVTVPSVETEDRRHLHRGLETLKADRTRLHNRLRGLLMTHGVQAGPRQVPDLASVRTRAGEPLPPTLLHRLQQLLAHRAFLSQQIRQLEAMQRTALRAAPDRALRQVRQLQQLRGIGRSSAWLFVMEAFGWRDFRNARQIGALSGLAPTPYQSGTSRVEQGIAKSGNRRWRTMAVEIAWGWLRFQRASALSRWYERRFAAGGPRARRIGMVALARKLLVALWRYLQTGIPPAGAIVRFAV